YLGRLEKKKNVLGLINAFNKVINQNNNDEIKLVLAGQPGLGYDQIKEAIEKNNLNDKIIQLGWADQIDVPYLMAGALALVMPSFYEGFGLPVLEALACGTPVIGSNSTAIPEIVAGAALLVDPNDTAKLAEAMTKIINNDELRQELIEAGIKRAQDFSWEKCAQETLEIIQKI
ncbi:MAG: glycosyltransferase family 1 protein, partial [bacterium]